MTPQPHNHPPLSPHTTKPKQQQQQQIANVDPTLIIPLDSPSRTSPIHPLLPTIKIRDSSLSSSRSGALSAENPLTLTPWTPDDLKHHNYAHLRAQYPSPNAAAAAREEAVLELKNRLEESERRTRELEREMEEKEKTREIERKVWMKRRGEGGAG